MKKLLKDKFMSWEAYRDNETTDPKIEEYTVDGKQDYSKFELIKFQNWAIKTVEFQLIETGSAIPRQKDIVAEAIAKWRSAPAQGNYVYTAIADTLQNSLDMSSKKFLHLNSEAKSENVSNTWA